LYLGLRAADHRNQKHNAAVGALRLQAHVRFVAL
jgi:hypothetical protein